MPELKWRAMYNDGSQIRQVEDDGKKYAYKDIERENLAMFVLESAPGRTVYAVRFQGDGKKLVWRRRVEQKQGGEPTVCHVIGKKGRFISIVFENGGIISTNNFDKDDAWMYPVEYTKEEK